MKKNKVFPNSFTLIELLVVVAVIGLITSIIFVSFFGVRAESRDIKRKSEVNSISKALELYYTDNNYYPIEPVWTSIETDASFTQEMEPYMSAVPHDPLFGQTGQGGEPYSYQYTTTGDGQHWAIKTLYETEGSEEREESIVVYSSSEAESIIGGGAGGIEEQLAEAMDCPELASLNFSTGGDVIWQVDETEFYTGDSSARSGTISDNQISWWQIQPDEAGLLSLRSKVSCGSGDFFRICLSGQSYFCSNVSGESGWNNTFSGSMYPGDTLKVMYVKNGSGSSGRDAGWVDNVTWTPQ